MKRYRVYKNEFYKKGGSAPAEPFKGLDFTNLFTPMIDSTSESDESTPTNIKINRKSIMTAPV